MDRSQLAVSRNSGKSLIIAADAIAAPALIATDRTASERSGAAARTEIHKR